MPIYGPKWPLKRGNKDTYQLNGSLKEQVNFYLKNLLLTSPGENISAPLYGIGLRRFLFEPNTDQVRTFLQNRIALQISKYLAYLIVKEISVSASNEEIDSNTLKIRIKYSIPKRVDNEIFELSIGQTSDIGFY
tara:strand:- start:581 stop:982 length:402 start_codon:yes stop_codon:yes gene_type:complete